VGFVVIVGSRVRLNGAYFTRAGTPRADDKVARRRAIVAKHGRGANFDARITAQGASAV
jgi:hypothetical protein